MKQIVMLFAVLSSVAAAHAAEVKLNITSIEGGKAAVTFDTVKSTWNGVNISGEKLLKSTSGNYKSGTNVVPGFATKGTGLLKQNDDKTVEAYFTNFIPTTTKPGETGAATMLETVTTGTWKR